MAPDVVRTARKKITIERTFKGSVEDAWELWTTKDGIEAWWGPDGFQVKVRRLDLRPGDAMDYTMTAIGRDQVEFLKNAGMPVASEHRVIFEEISPRRRLAFKVIADFIPGVMPYDVHTVIEFSATAYGVRMVLTFDAMHDEHWTKLAVMGRESELDRLGRILEARK